jgi:para-aminobenzoate synthetase component I
VSESLVIETRSNPGLEALLRGALAKYAERDGFFVWDEASGSSATSFIFLEPVIRWSSGEISREVFEGRFLEEIHLPLLSMGRPKLPVPLGASFIAYEFLHSLETVPRPREDPFQIPDFAFYLYRRVLSVPRSGGVVTEYRFNESKVPTALWEVEESLDELCSQLPSTQAAESNANESPRSNFKESKYLETIEEIKSRINRGEVYQVNLSQRFSGLQKQPPLHFFLALREETNPLNGAFFSSLRTDGSGFSISSASPELFFNAKDRTISCSPIKGTRARGSTPGEDERLVAQLKESTKDKAELAMIVDLVRNDLGRVCEIGTIRVDAHARIETHPYVHHLVSDISGTLKPGLSLSHIISALFPSGSVTGAPKIAAMKAISRLEGTTRGVYTGAIGCFGADFSRFNVAIRTAFHAEHIIIFQAGGGITIESNPRDEYEETLQKAKPILDTLRR